jgi:hypothetical protein
MVFRYNGGSCQQSFNIQPAALFNCTDSNGGPPNTEGSQAFISITDGNGLGNVYFSGFATVGDELTLENNGTLVDTSMNVTIYSSDNSSSSTLLQSIAFQTTCSRNLFLKDRFGSMQLLIFVNGLQGVVSSMFEAIFDFFIVNTGDFPAELVSLVSVTNVGVLNLTDRVFGTELAPGEQLVLVENVVIDLTVRQTYTALTTVIGQTVGSEALCNDTDSLTFVAGNPPPVNIPTMAPSKSARPTIKPSSSKSARPTIKPSGKGSPTPPSGKGSPTPPSGKGSPTPPSGKGSPTPPSSKGSPTPPSGKGSPSQSTVPKGASTPVPAGPKGASTPVPGGTTLQPTVAGIITTTTQPTGVAGIITTTTTQPTVAVAV